MKPRSVDRCLKEGCPNEPTEQIAFNFGWGDGRWQVLGGRRWAICPEHAASLTVEVSLRPLLREAPDPRGQSNIRAAGGRATAEWDADPAPA